MNVINITKINLKDVNDYCDAHHFGWTSVEVCELRKRYQSKFFANEQDLILEVCANFETPYYAIFRAGKSTKKQTDYLFNNENSVITVNSNGNIYRFDVDRRRCLDSSCYSAVLFDNTQENGSISPFLYSVSSNKLGLMAVVDDEGLAILSWDNVLWKKEFEYAYADDVEIISISGESLVIEYQPPYGNKGCIFLNTMTGDVLTDK